MALKRPTLEDFANIAAQYGLGLSTHDLEVIHTTLGPTIQGFELLDQWEAASAPKVTPRDPGFSPSVEDNPYGAWYWKAAIEGAASGPLAGKTIAIKDNVAVAGLPLTNGSRLLRTFVPREDATVVQRILKAGGTIGGKAVCENLCFSGSSFTSDSGPVRNPYDPTRSAGGSSSGSAVLVAIEEVDMAIGGDQGGSIRIPASWCGIYGLKPTWGLVPYTGAFPIEPTLDHLGPMAGTVQDLAQLLEVIVGPDGSDPRQMMIPEGVSVGYSKALGQSLAGLRIGIVQEGFAWPQSDPAVDEMVRTQVQRLEQLGVQVQTISIPLHRQAMAIWNGIGIEGTLNTMMLGNAYGSGWKGRYDPELMQTWGDTWREQASDLPPTVKQLILMAEYLRSQSSGRYYGIAQNMASALTEAYDRAMAAVDLLVMPTLPMVASALPAADAPLEDVFERAFEMLNNTAPFDVTGHPAITIPIGMEAGLPVGLMAIAPKFAEGQLIRLASGIEQHVFKPSKPQMVDKARVKNG